MTEQLGSFLAPPSMAEIKPMRSDRQALQEWTAIAEAEAAEAARVYVEHETERLHRIFDFREPDDSDRNLSEQELNVRDTDLLLALQAIEIAQQCYREMPGLAVASEPLIRILETQKARIIGLLATRKYKYVN